MKRLFLLIPALVLSLAISADVLYINTGTADALRKALNNAQSGDIIEMAAGTYVESPENWIAFTNKSVTVRAAEGAEVILQPQVSIRLKEGATAEFIGIKFDCGHLSDVNSYDNVIFPADATDGKNIILRNCEFYGWTQNNAIINSSTSNTLNSLIIENCYFHDVTKSCVFLQNTSNAVEVEITNSTFANISTVTESYYAGVIDMRSTTGSLTVDHCTFYNVQAMSTDFAAIGKIGSGTTAVVSNCIFAMPTSTSGVRTIRDAVTANNCLVFNYSSDSGYGMQGNVTKNNCTIADPLFTDAANGDFSYAGNWVTMSLSPARGAATDGTDLGDPSWYSAEVLPSVDFASDYNLVGAKALLTGNIELNESSHIKYTGSSTPGIATWKMHITKKCVINAVADREAESTSGCELTLTVYDAEGNEVSTISAPSSHNDNDINFNGSLFIPGEGDYTIKLTNATGWSGAILEKIILSYVGGDVQAMPGTTDIDDAWFSSNGTRADGKISYSSVSSGCWAKWNIAVASAGTYNVTVNISGQYGHKYVVEFLKEGESTPIVVTKDAINYNNDPTLYANELGTVVLEAANYEMKVFNDVGDAALHSVTLAYAGGGVIEFGKSTAGSLLANADAIVSDDWSIEGGKITHAESKALTGWAKWNVDCQDYGNYNVTVNISSDNGHLVRVEIFENEAEPAIYTLDETSSTKWDTGDQAIDLGNIVLDDREYVVKVSNTGEYSHVQIASIVITYQNGAKQNIPGTLTLTDAMLSDKAYIESSMLYFAPHDCATIPDEWAKWNLSVASAGVYQFTVNVTSPNGQKYQILIEDNGGNEVYNLVQTSSLGSGDKSFTTGMIYMESGDYTLEMRNVYPYSDGHLVSISAAAVANVLTIDENATDNNIIRNNYRNGAHTIRLIRTITPNMYNTICLPFDVNSTQLQAIFGSDVELLQMASASLGGDVLDLNFDAATSIYRGTPYLIRTTKTVSNPVFTEVEIKEETGQATAGDNANFVGTFIQGTIPAGENNLFLGANNLLYFSDAATTIKGMRAYFQVNNPSGAPIRQARIVEKDNVVTELELIDGEWQDIKSANGTIKTIENGQLILIRDGKRYNVIGVRF